ncbi:MAG: choice-of-anchor L domain-containing protein [Saprospiraceae bacterium]|nr:choice-of-anchor L domain-containing protein [Saprospiraceae bacterium]MDW8482990.1 choice-of-anchor L domain-containing protein [Saprospiraceae bacterium]
MKKLLVLLLLWHVALASVGQVPTNDDCSNPLHLGIAPVCSSTEYTNVNATPSNIGDNNQPSCFSTMDGGNDVWFTFICPSNPLDFRITLTPTGADPIINPQLTIYRGECSPDGLAELDCVVGSGTLLLDVQGLTPGAIYFIRVSSAGPSANAGIFTLCVNEIPPILTIDQGGSTLCSGTLYDTGGPTGNYGSNEDHTFVICPSAPAACIEFTLEYYNLDAGDAFSPGLDVLTFYDGPNTNSPILAQINGLTQGTAIDGGGGVCFQVRAESGCLTVQFQSNFGEEHEGFKGTWKCGDKPCEPYTPINVQKDVTAQDIVNAIAAPGAVVTIKDLSRCPHGAYGTFSFDADNNPLGLKQGLLLTTGLVELVPGPNDNESATFPHEAPGDADLDYLSVSQGNGLPSEDACIIELDVFVTSDELAFEYVFGSEEYPEYANSDYNDIFAFFASGPGIAGDPNLGGALNIAVLPGTNTPVQINSVNNLVNWQYYRNTEVSQILQYDGFTSDFLGVKKSLTARLDVIPCNTYRLKLAIADRQDPLFDSGVFISEVRAGAPELAVQLSDNLDYLVEDCSIGESRILVRLRKPKAKATTYTITLGGSAVKDLDYQTDLPNTLTFQPGDSLFVFSLVPLSDSLQEGTETITISLSADFGCGTTVFQTVTLELLDGIRVRINDGLDTIFFCPGATVQLQAVGAETYFWTPPAAVNNPNINNPVTTPTQNLKLKVVGTLGVCTDTAEVFLKRIESANVQIVALDTALCLYDTVSLLATTSPPGLPVSWTPKARLSAPNEATTLAYPLTTTTYQAAVQIAGCSPVAAAVTLVVDTLSFPSLRADTTICEGTAVLLAAPIEPSTSNYQWTPTTGLDDPTKPNPVATPVQTTTYLLKATSANGGCSRIDSVTIAVIPSAVRILNADTLNLCLGDSAVLQVQASPPGAIVHWLPAAWIKPDTGSIVVVKPKESITFYASYYINGCTARDSVHIRVDSLPSLAIRLEPLKDIYCPGDTIYLLSKTYDPADFPGLRHRWEPFGGQLTPVENWNMVITATQTHTFRRLTRSLNGACLAQAEVLVRVDTPPVLSAVVNPPAICPGQAAQIQLTVSPSSQPVEWDDPSGTLSCRTCLNPIASPVVSTTYTVKTPGANCPRSSTVEVVVLPLPALDLTPRTLCRGDTVRLNAIPTNPADSYTWTVVPPGDAASLANPNAPSPVVRPSFTTTYRVTASGQCTRQGEVTLTVNSATLDVGPDRSTCPGTPVTLTATTTTSPGVIGTVVWLPGPGTGPSLTVAPTATTTYTAVYTFPPNCITTDTVTITVLPGVILSALSADSLFEPVLCEGTPIKLRTGVTPPGSRLTWFENGQLISDARADSLIRRPAGDVEPVAVSYVVVAENDEGCRDTSNEFRILVRRCLAFPNAFTPNGDGDNDTFSGPISFGEGSVEVVDLRIFNRWGQQVFVASPSQRAWDGRLNGEPAPSDVYVYVVVVRFANGQQQTFTGDVTLLR